MSFSTDVPERAGSYTWSKKFTPVNGVASLQRRCPCQRARKGNHHDAEPLRPRTIRSSSPSGPYARGRTRATAGTVVSAQTPHPALPYTIQNILASLPHSPFAQITAAHCLRKENGHAHFT